MKLDTKKFGSIVTGSNRIGGGGEGKVYPVSSPANLTDYVVKIYEPKYQTTDREQKLIYMVNNPPTLQDAYSVIWPQDVVLEKGKFRGYLMLKAEGELLSKFMRFKLPTGINPGFHKFDLSTPTSMEERLKVIYNISAAVSQVHASGSYVFGDLKPANIMLWEDSTVSIIDMDSVQIAQNGQVLFPSPVATPEYLPPEAYNKGANNTVPEVYDRFALSVMFYWFLNGQHPANGTYTAPYTKGTDLAYGIKNGLFACIQEKHKYYNHTTASFQLHQKIQQLPQEVQQLFVRCFGDGTANPDTRPSARDWCVSLKDILTNRVSGVHKPLFPPTVVSQGKTVFHQPPEILSFSIDKTEILEGEQVTLSWSASAYDRLKLSGDKKVDVSGKNSKTLQPKSNTHYTLTATSRFGSVRKSLTVRVHPKPAIRNFTVTKYNVLRGEPIVIQWEAINAEKLILQANGKSIDVTGHNSVTKTLNINKDVSLSLTAFRTHPNYSVTEKAVIKAYPQVSISAFSADKAKIVKGDSACLSWAVTGANNVEIRHLGKVTSIGKRSISPDKTTQYQLIAKNPVSIMKAEVTVEVFPMPVITTFQASMSQILKGSDVRLSWSVTGAEAVYLSDGRNKWLVNGSEQVVTPDVSTTYKLEAHSAESLKVIEGALNVGVLGEVEILRFVTDEDIPFTVAGIPLKLEFDTSYATRVILGGNGQTVDVTGKKYIEVMPERSCIYSLIAANTCSRKERELTIHVLEILAYYPCEKELPDMKLDFALITMNGFNINQIQSS